MLVIILAISGAVWPCPAWAQGTTTRVSVGPGGVQADDHSVAPALSADGRFVAFESTASTLVTGDTNGASDVFLQDRLTGMTTRVSIGALGEEGDGHSHLPALSADAQFVAFHSFASNLVTGDTNGTSDVFVHDRLTGTATRVSVATGGGEGNGHSYFPALSADGRFVAFYSQASNLVAGDTNGHGDVFVHDRLTGSTTRVSVGTGEIQGNGESYSSALSADGRFVAFASLATNLVPADTNGYVDVFVHDRQTGTTTRVSVGSGGTQADGESYSPALSADGRFVAFTSSASNLDIGGTNGATGIYVHDRVMATTKRVSVGAGGVQGNDYSYMPALSADGRFVAFHSSATNLVPGDTNATWDVFLHERATGTTTRVSVGEAGVQGNSASYSRALSGDGRFVAFYSIASNLVTGDTNGALDVFVHDRNGSLSAPLPAGDYDGDGRADIAVYRPSNGVWYIVRSTTGIGVATPWGTAGDIPVPADYDGDGKTDVAVYRPSTGVWWIIRSSTGAGAAIRWGTSGDIPVPADYDGDGRKDVAVYRPSSGVWYIIRSTTGVGIAIPWGTAGDLPVAADYDGDRRADPTVFRPSNGAWYQLRSTTGAGYMVPWGTTGDVPLAADFDRDGRADPTVFRPGNGTWYQLRSTTGVGYGVPWGTAGDLPIAGDYDGDGHADPTVFRPSNGTWYQLRSLTGSWLGLRWGTSGDLPQ